MAQEFLETFGEQMLGLLPSQDEMLSRFSPPS